MQANRMSHLWQMTSPKESLTQFNQAGLYLRIRLQNDLRPLKELQRFLSQLKEDPPEGAWLGRSPRSVSKTTASPEGCSQAELLPRCSLMLARVTSGEKSYFPATKEQIFAARDPRGRISWTSQSVLTSKYRTQFSNRRSNSLSYPISMPSAVFSINLREKSESFESYSSTSDLFTRNAMTLRLKK